MGPGEAGYPETKYVGDMGDGLPWLTWIDKTLAFGNCNATPYGGRWSPLSGRNPDAFLRVPPLHIPDLGHNIFKESIKNIY